MPPDNIPDGPTASMRRFFRMSSVFPVQKITQCVFCGEKEHAIVRMAAVDQPRWIRRLDELGASKKHIACILDLPANSKQLEAYYARRPR